MKHPLFILISFILLSSPVIGQSERPETIIIPVSSLGDVSEVRKQILQNTLTNELKKHFRIVPQEKYEQVLEQVFEELEYEECSEDTCIMRVQEMLQVENVFHLQVIGEGKDSQLNLKWITLDEKKNEEDYCRGCGTFELREMIGGLVEKLVGEKKVEVVVEKKPVVVVEKKGKGVLYHVKVNGQNQYSSNWVWKKSGNEKKDDKYVGEIEDGKPNGQGTYTQPNGGKYVGEFKDGKYNGQGTHTHTDGTKYVGNWKDDEFHGFGTFQRFGTQQTPVSTHVGYWREGLMQGKGKFILHDIMEYVGEFKDGEENGQGTVTYINAGTKYVGEFKDGRENGKGTHTTYKGLLSGLTKEGIFKDGKLNGKGTMTFPNGTSYLGNWKDGRENGQGTMTFPDGNKYVGELDGNYAPNGQGTMTFPDGRKYVGEWKDGLTNGEGIFNLADGGKFIGEFRNGKPWNTKLYDGYGKLRGRKVNGKWK